MKTANKKPWTIFDSEVLFQNKNWSIEKISPKELAFTDGYRVCYAYVNENFTSLVFDIIYPPKYIREKGLRLAKKHIESVYAD